jgi:peptide deformylase
MALDSATLKIVNYPHPVLRQTAQPVPKVTDQVRQVALRMLQLMHEAPGVGLAAPQVGLNWRLFVANHTQEPENDLVFINPSLSEPSTETDEFEEGCLSLPDIRAAIRRPVGITIQALDLQGKPFKMSSDELSARIWQHEYDHLEGVLIIDLMGMLDRRANREALDELEKAAEK